MTTEAGRPSGSTLAEKSLGSAIEAWTKMKPLIFSAALATVLLDVGAYYLEITLGILPHGRTVGNVVIGLLRVPFQALINAPLAVAIHRLILLGEITPGIISLRRNYHWAFFAWLCAMDLLSNFLINISGPAVGLLAIPAIFLTVKCALIFPAVAIESPASDWQARLKISWRQMNGNFWLFVRAMLLAILPVFLVFLIPIVIVVVINAVIFHATENRLVLESALAGFFAPALIMTAAAVASWLYAWVRQQPAS